MINPITVNNSVLVSSSIDEDDYPVWDSGTTYSAEDRVIVVGTTHKIYESVVNSNVGQQPQLDTDNSHWIEVSATNRWKAFDGKLSDQASDTSSIYYELLMPSNVTGIAIFNPEGTNLNITITSGSTEVFNQDYDIIDLSGDVTDWLEYFTTDLSENYKNVILTSIPAYAGSTVEITITGGSIAKVGEIVLGAVRTLGQSNYGTGLSILDFSTKETDTFGNYVVIERAFQDEVNFQFQVETGNVGKVKRWLSERRALPTVYFTDFDQEQYGGIAYGYYEDFDLPLSGPSLSFATLSARGLT